MKIDLLKEKYKKLFKNGINRLTFNLTFFGLIIICLYFSQYFTSGYIFGLLLVVLIILSILRIRNLGRSSWYILGFAVPLYRLYLFILLVFIKKSEVEKMDTLLKIIIGIFGFTFGAILATIAFISLQELGTENIDINNSTTIIDNNLE